MIVKVDYVSDSCFMEPHSPEPRAAWQHSYGQPHLSRSSYPSFLSLPETLRLHLGFLARGFVDASRWDITVKTVYSWVLESLKSLELLTWT